MTVIEEREISVAGESKTHPNEEHHTVLVLDNHPYLETIHSHVDRRSRILLSPLEVGGHQHPANTAHALVRPDELDQVLD